MNGFNPYKRVNGGVLGVAVCISVLISILSGFILTRAQYFSYANHQYDLRESLVRNSRSGIQFLLSNQSLVQPGEKKIIDLFGNQADSVELSRKPWGGYEIIVSKAFSHGKTICKTALVGQTSSTDSLRTSLYLCDLDRPLSVCGNTRLDGRLYLPKSGVRRAYIEGQNYTGDKLVYGARFNSGQYLPQLNKELVETNYNYLNRHFSAEDSIISWDKLPDTLTHSFRDKSLVVYSDDLIQIDNQIIEGNVILVAHKIIVGRNTIIKDVLLYAYEIQITDHVAGCFQAFAKDHIRIGKKCEFSFPSVFMTIHKGKQQKEILPSIFIDEGTEITGEICCYSDISYEHENSISIQKHTAVIGEVYVNGLLDLQGNVFGSVFCHRFMMKTPSSTYENHLLNSEINAKKLPKHFTGMNLLSTENKKAVVRWM